MRFVDEHDGRYVSVADVISMLVQFAPVVRDKAGVDWPVSNVIAHILYEDLRTPVDAP